MGVVVGEEAREEFFEILVGSLRAVRQTLHREDAEEAFDKIHPRGVRGSVVKVNSRVAPEPATGGLILVDVQMIRDT